VPVVARAPATGWIRRGDARWIRQYGDGTTGEVYTIDPDRRLYGGHLRRPRAADRQIEAARHAGAAAGAVDELHAAYAAGHPAA